MLTRIGEHSLYGHPGLGIDTVVLDLGANRGRFARGMRAAYGCQVYAVEPNPALVRDLPGDVATLAAAVSGETGTARFHLMEQDEWSSLHGRGPIALAETIAVRTYTLADLLDVLDVSRVDVLKLDIEGAEIDVLLQAPAELLQDCEQITVEFHDFHGFTPREDCERVIRRMESLGFLTISVLRETYGDVLFLNRRRVPLAGALVAKHWTRNWWGLKRVVGRLA